MELRQRIASPVSGRVDDDAEASRPPTPRMLASRYALTAWLPAYALASAPFDLSPPMGILVTALVGLVLLTWGASGSWWRAVRGGPWIAAHLGAAALVGAAWIAAGVVGEPMLVVVPSLLVLGGVLGAAAMHAWLARAAR